MKKGSLKRAFSMALALLLAFSGIEMSGFAGTTALAADGRKIDVWDFGSLQESDTSLYNNHITVDTWNNEANVSTAGKFTKGASVFGDLTLNYENNDRLFQTLEGANKNYGTNALATAAYDDGYTATGMFYCNGTGNPAKRHITIDNVAAGDTFFVYMASSNAVTGELQFTHLGEEETVEQTDPFTNKGEKHIFVAKNSGTYRINTTAVAGKPIYNRIMRIPGVEVSGSVDTSKAEAAGFGIKFTSNTTGDSFDASVDGSKFTACLPAGDTFTASLTGLTGVGFTNATKTVKTEIANVVTGQSGVTLATETKSVYKYTGSVKGFDASVDLSKITVVLTPDANVDTVKFTPAADGSFSATLSPDVTYTASIEGANDYEIKEGLTVVDTVNHESDIVVAKKAVFDVTGKLSGIDDTTVVSDMKFINVEDKYSYAASIKDGAYSVALRDGSYEIDVTVEGFRTTTHVVVKGGAVNKDIMFVSTKPAEPLTRVSDIYVGYKDKTENNYATVNEAVKAAALMNPSSEEERITIHIAPGTYREQVIITTPYLSLVNDSKEKVLLTWYYGIGYEYYSIDSTGYYNPENAYDKYQKGNASRWGTCVYVKNTAKSFKASNITFENSFNRYITDEEIEDGVAATSGLPARQYGTDVTAKAATERATAFAIEADDSELVNCSFYGSQDTLFTGNDNINLYFKNCLISGNTDYIFGDGNVVFDGCELQWYGYSTGSVGGYITAFKTDNKGTPYGYLFRNCVITSNSELTVTPGYLGRPWGADARVTFVNTKLESSTIVEKGWTDMSGNKPENANFYEYNTVCTDGTAVDLSQRTGKVMTEADFKAIDVINNNLAGWTPASYKADEAALSFETKPYVVDNGDINAPYPGHTLTVGYQLNGSNAANDASVIRWYIVDADGKETLVKSTTAAADNTYKITSDAVNKHIKVVVVPETISGLKASEESYKVEAFVRDGYENPSTGNTDVTLGEGINIFLAGDSTVKDYSAAGMYNSGKAQNEGSWGEFLQAFFDESQVKIQNYANGGRSTRNFINEGSLDKIAANIKAGDYLFIQFGHNDCANSSGYLEDRYVPLGEPDANGIFPVTAGTKVATPSSLQSKYGDLFYSYDCGGTFKWYLQQYIDVAKNAGATPVLVTPVARTYFNSDGSGKITPHHDSTDDKTGTYVSSNNAYVTAYKQLAQETGVLLIDGYDLTKTMYETAYSKDGSASGKISPLVAQVMAAGESTHSNKLGGFMSAALMAKTIQDMNLNISSVVNTPVKVGGTNPDGQQVFTVNGSGKLSAYTKNEAGEYNVLTEYWTVTGQELIDAITAKHEELSNKPDEELELSIDDTGRIIVTKGGKLVEDYNGWFTFGGREYWIDNGYVAADKEVYDPAKDMWMWFDADGSRALDKDVFLPINEDKTEGKWVRYDADGKMIKGWSTNSNGTYYFDEVTGAMVKGDAFVGNERVYFNEITGVGYNGWRDVDGTRVWYENGVMQGCRFNSDGTPDISYRGKEIYDKDSDAWYWLDCVAYGAVAKSKDVYQESLADDNGTIGKWVRYNADGKMVKGWDTNDKGVYYFDPVYGTMYKGWHNIEGMDYYFDETTGIRQ